jgi:hypothetical protein
MWAALIASIAQASQKRRERRDRQEQILSEGPSWRYRRRLIHGAYIMGVAMILFGAFTFLMDSQISVEMIIGGVALISIIVTAYTTSATYEDVRIWNQDKRIRFGEKSPDEFDIDNPDGL